MNSTERKRRIDSYEKAHENVVAALKEIPRDMWQYKPGPKKWSVHEILIHLADAEMNSSVRLRTFVAQPGHRIMAYDQDTWADSLVYAKQSSEDALSVLKYLRKLNTQLLRSLPDQTFQNTIDHPESGKMTLDEWLVIYDDHTTKHIGQMKRNLETWKVK